MRPIELVNEYAAEHLIISCDSHGPHRRTHINTGSVLEACSPESVGDYASSAITTLPTNGL